MIELLARFEGGIGAILPMARIISATFDIH